MTHKLRWLAIAGLMALLAAFAAACGAERHTPQRQPTYCDLDADGVDDVQCGDDPNVTCDPLDGVCKCGGSGGEVCGPDQICVMRGNEPAACETNLCATVQCQRGMSCNPIDGSCHCGGDVCGAGERCENDECVSAGLCDSVVCGPGETCDDADGLCKCGGQLCTFGQLCVDEACVTNPCAGVNCGPGLYCNPDDGFCHCGAEDGPICGAGQSCVNDGTGPVCIGENPCDGVVCPTGSVCNPDDGACYCGGAGPTNPVCGEDQTCDPTVPQCLGGDRCMVGGQPKVCDVGLSCDPEDGVCKCGGLNGIACEPGDRCVAVGGDPFCAPACDFLEGVGCGPGFGCYLDDAQPDQGMFCAPLPLDPRIKGDPCTSTLECGAGLHCIDLPGGARCRPYCDTRANHCTEEGEVCYDLLPGPENLGVCVFLGG